MKGRSILLLFCLFTLLLPTITQIAESYEINPAKWIFYNKDEYEIKPIFFNFQIKNTQNDTIQVSLKTIPPERLYSDQYPGDQAFPDYSWITISEQNVVIPANQTVEVPVHVAIPTQYTPTNSTTPISNYNKTYEAWFLVNQTAGPGNIHINYKCRWVFLTPTRYVPTWERKGAWFPYPDYVLYSLIGVIAIIIVVAVWFVLRSRGGGKRPTSSSRGKKSQDEGDIFS